MAMPNEAARPGARSETDGRTPGLTMPQALVISVVFTVVFVLAVVMRLDGMPALEVLKVLGGAGGIGAGLVLAVTPGGRGRVAAMVRAAVHADR
ncbi:MULTISPECIES: hypothetical protein [unclassified Streptomyces]|uniref:hypothetical protein n=1 Tax=Streptomyces sp. NPDC058812 TaxID=3346639 RepID=UPI0036CA3935